MSKLKELRLMLDEEDVDICITVRKLVSISLKEVFKDIIPDYRIRVATEKEKTQSVSSLEYGGGDYSITYKARDISVEIYFDSCCFQCPSAPIVCVFNCIQYCLFKFGISHICKPVAVFNILLPAQSI